MTTSKICWTLTVRMGSTIARIYASGDRIAVENKSGFFQVRPFKEFAASRGRERLLSLCRLSTCIPDDDILPPSSDIEFTSHSSARRNVYDFMQSRGEVTAPGDPTARRWTASIRLANFASVDSSPFCVLGNFLLF